MCDFLENGFMCRGDGFTQEVGEPYNINDIVDPCPKCNTKLFLEEAKITSEVLAKDCSGKTGDKAWLASIQKAKQFLTEAELTALLQSIGVVNALSMVDGKAVVKPFNYLKPTSTLYTRP
ncbi:hypothetical protein [Reinekea sp. G2M2-21]|uniref:hypothetical protein n=1 Tax=Reinekea sp. G2M2-21 TaxID=2788942 RepID=UPI0018A896FA|nr:hypothetical protein [Reinekea sp. G2M2-21]